MKRILFMGLCSLLWLPLAAQTATNAHHATASSSKHCLWQVTGITNRIYLMGSVHFLKAADYPLPAALEDAYRSTRVIAFETDIAALEDPTVQLQLAQAGMCAPGKTIADYLSPETYSLLQAKLSETIGIPGAFDTLRPWLAALSLALVELQKAGLGQEHGLDRYFHQLARKESREIVSLEDPSTAARIFAVMDTATQEAMLKETLIEIHTLQNELPAIVQAWRTGNLTELEKTWLAPMKQYPAVQKALLADRNRQWVPKIEALIRQKKDALVVVGTAHFIGQDNVLELLQAKGFKTEQR